MQEFYKDYTFIHLNSIMILLIPNHDKCSTEKGKNLNSIMILLIRLHPR